MGEAEGEGKGKGEGKEEMFSRESKLQAATALLLKSAPGDMVRSQLLLPYRLYLVRGRLDGMAQDAPPMQAGGCFFLPAKRTHAAHSQSCQSLPVVGL